jgi:preprotein translocase subunit SecF
VSLLKELYGSKSHIDFRPIWKMTVKVSAVLFVLALLLFVVRGVNLSIDFEGGGVFEVPVAEDTTVADARSVINVADSTIQTVTDADGGKFIRVQTPSGAIEDPSEIVGILAELGGVTPDDVSITTVGPTWGDQITNKAIRALMFFFVAVAGYLAWSLEWKMAIGALVAVVHDLAITAGVYSLFGFEVSPATVIALLTILGYSIYDTVVVYDKVLENADERVQNYTSLVNKSMNQVLMRSINTTITTVLPVVSMLVIGGFFLGGDSIKAFALALFIGLILGTYSSIFLAAPLLAWLHEREAK